MYWTICSLFFLTVLLQVNSQTLPPMTPGACLEGEYDNVTHAANTYPPFVPVTYTFTPSGASVPASAAPTSLVFMSYNIQSDFSLYCQKDLSNQTAFISQIAPDFLGLQECDIDVDIRCNCDMAQIVADQTGLTARFMLMFPFRNGLYGDIAATSFNVIDVTYVYYNVSNPSFEQRGALAHLVQPPQLQGRFLWYINTHLEYSNGEIRTIQCQQLVAYVRDTLLVQYPEAMVVITGDFYTLVGDGSYEVLSAYFDNAWVTFSGSTDGGFTHPSDTPSDRFDNIWYKTPSDGLLNVNILSFEIPDVLLSDHRPIIATFNFTVLANVSEPTIAPTATPIPTDTATPTSTPTNTPTNTPTTIPTIVPTTPAPTLVPTATHITGISTSDDDPVPSGKAVPVTTTTTTSSGTISIAVTGASAVALSFMCMLLC